MARTGTPEPIRTIDVALSRYAFAPERIEVHVGERVRLDLHSMDRAGRAVIESTPKTAGA